MTDTTRDGRPIDVVDNVEQQQFEARVEGAVVGKAVYETQDGKVVFIHTEVDPSMQGQGVANVLARVALDQMRAGGRTIVPLCPFISAYIRRHPAFVDLVDEDHRGWVQPPVG
jgi:uncharacterized protein